MNFYDKMASLGFSLKDKKESILLFERPGTYCGSIMLFYVKDKTVSGYVKPNDLIKDIDSVSAIYTEWRQLQKDVSELANLCNYSII